jgi:hypothetical protein
MRHVYMAAMFISIELITKRSEAISGGRGGVLLAERS